MTSEMASQASGSSVESERVGVHVQLGCGAGAKADAAGHSSSSTLTDAQIRALVQELKPKVRYTQHMPETETRQFRMCSCARG